MRVYVVHYSEIALKGKNRSYFERKLVSNIKEKIKKGEKPRIRREYGRIVVESGSFEIGEILKKTPGVRYFALAIKTEPDIDGIIKAAVDLAPDSGTFRVETKRSFKEFPLNSMEVNRIVGEEILKRKNLKVNLKNPEKTVYIEISDRNAYIYSERVDGVGGLPVGVSGRVACLLSGGIDSPVSAFMAMKRGAEAILIHFFNSTLHSPGVRRKIHDIARKLSEYHRLKLYMVPFRDIQLEIVRCIPSDYRMIIYRRSMMRMAGMIAERENAKALFTGDNLGQVASQTLANMKVIYNASDYPVFTPLIGFDKEEIVDLAKKIGTYGISILPYDDCCSLMVSRHPVTNASIEEVERMEEVCDLREKEAVESAEIFEYG